MPLPDGWVPPKRSGPVRTRPARPASTLRRLPRNAALRYRASGTPRPMRRSRRPRVPRPPTSGTPSPPTPFRRPPSLPRAPPPPSRACSRPPTPPRRSARRASTRLRDSSRMETRGREARPPRPPSPPPSARARPRGQRAAVPRPLAPSAPRSPRSVRSGLGKACGREGKGTRAGAYCSHGSNGTIDRGAPRVAAFSSSRSRRLQQAASPLQRRSGRGNAF